MGSSSQKNGSLRDALLAFRIISAASLSSTIWRPGIPRSLGTLGAVALGTVRLPTFEIAVVSNASSPKLTGTSRYTSQTGDPSTTISCMMLHHPLCSSAGIPAQKESSASMLAASISISRRDSGAPTEPLLMQTVPGCRPAAAPISLTHCCSNFVASVLRPNLISKRHLAFSPQQVTVRRGLDTSPAVERQIAAGCCPHATRLLI
mmetsp:Transcript_8736/g.15733  ORF Transcript_8736/g.15733 Transcript_8736/m.15733 type:complete len:205 (+) Transcript_8736:332-946(+)